MAIILIPAVDCPVFAAENQPDLVGFSDIKVAGMIVEIERGREYAKQISAMQDTSNELLKEIVMLNEIVAAQDQKFEAAQKMIHGQKDIIDLCVQGMESRDAEIVDLKKAEITAWFKGGLYGAAIGIVLTIAAMIVW